MIATIIANKLIRQLECLEYGKLTLTMPQGSRYQFEGKHPGYTADVVIHDWRVLIQVVLKGDVGFAEQYRDGGWQTNDLKQLIALLLQNRDVFADYTNGNGIISWLNNIAYFLKRNTLSGSQKNIHAHYDLGNEFYSLWLDSGMTYSSAIFKQSDNSLHQAQNNKYDRILDRLDSSSGELLEVGCGWGGFAERCKNKHDHDIKCITLSKQQHKYAVDRLKDKASVRLEDYRVQAGRYDNIVSIEMFEAVGEKYWGTYFNKLKSLLKPKGNAVIQTIVMNDEDFPRYRRSSDFIRSYIFPGGMLPSPSVFKHHANKAGLKVHDEFNFAADYSRTLDCWLSNFESKTSTLKKLGFDDGFIRLWRFYLAACSAAFETGRTNVMQVQLSHA